MDKILTICFHQILGAIYSFTENASMVIQLVTVVLLSVGLFRVCRFLARTLVSTSSFIRNLDLISVETAISSVTGNPDDPGTIKVIPDQSTEAAFTVGWFKPEIFVTSGLVSQLDKNALDIVIRHELGHKRRRDPLRHMLLNASRELLWFIPSMSVHVERARLASELACDSFAVAAGHDRITVAKVLLDVAGGPAIHTGNPAPAMSSIKDHLEIRVRSLLGENALKMMRIPFGVMLASFLIVASIIVSSGAIIATRIDPGGYVSIISQTSQACDAGHPEIDLISEFGFECPHCGQTTSETSTTPSCN